MFEKFGVVDSVRITHRDKFGNIKREREYPRDFGLLHRLLVKLHLKHNTISKFGMAIVAKLIAFDIGETAFDYIGIGTGNQASSVNDNDLQVLVKKKASTSTVTTTTYTNDTAQWVATFSNALDGLTGQDSICEVTIHNASSGVEKILLRQVYSPADPCDWSQGDSLQITVKCQVKQGS